MIDIYLDEDSETIQRLNTAPSRLVAAITGSLLHDAQLVADEIRRNASGGMLQQQTGALADSVLELPVQSSGESASVAIVASGGDTYYGKILERGTKAYEERPRFREAVKGIKGVRRAVRARKGAHAMLFSAGGGSQIFAKVVEHPAIAPRPWFSSVLARFTPQIVDDMTRAVSDALEK
jgi:hypothetical protein